MRFIDIRSNANPNEVDIMYAMQFVNLILFRQEFTIVDRNCDSKQIAMEIVFNSLIAQAKPEMSL